MAERIPDSLIDEILASAKNYMVEETETEYSADKIDALIGDITKAETQEPVATEKTVIVPNFKKEKREFSLNISEVSFAEEEQTEEVTEKTGDVGVLVADDGQIGLMSDGVEISSETDAEDIEETEEKEELKSVSGQISIEKTRMFNEVDIRGAYNPNISHNLGNKVARTTTGEAQPLSSSAIGEEKYRKHFMNKPQQNIEKTQEHRDLLASLPQKTIETPGVVVKKNKQAPTNTDGIEPMPTIVPAEYELEQEKTRFISTEAEENVSDNQIMLEGFGNDNEPVNIQTEEQAEEELRIKRQDKVKEFMSDGVLFQQEVEEPSTPKKRFDRQKRTLACEYYGPKEKVHVEEELLKEKSSLTIKTVVLSIICFIMAILAGVAGTENGNFEIYGNNEFVYVGVQLLLLLVACGLHFRSFTNTVKNLKNKTVDMDTVISVSALAGVLQCVFGFAFTDSVESVACLMSGAVLIPMIMKTVGELIRCKNDIQNFYIVSDEEFECFSVQNIPDEDAANEIARGLMLGDPDIKYSAKINFPARFVELSRSAEVTGPLFKIAVPVICIVALVIGLIYGVVSKNFFAGVSALTGIILMGLPVAASLISAVNLSVANKKLNAEGTAINGYSAVEDAVNSNGVMIDACDAFVSGGCNIEGMKLYHKMRIDEAILYTASVVIASGGVLADVFEGVIIGKKELLFPVESLSYEEKLGCSCWIHNHRVLVGNRELLVHHNVETPDKELEDKYRAMGKNVVYLAIEGKISAMFVVVYKANEETARYMRELEKDGLTIFFRTSDANITESFLEQEFGLPSNVVKIINPVAGEMFTKVKNAEIDRADAKIIHDGKVQTMLSALHSAFAISSYVTVSRTVQLVASFIGVVIVSLLAFLSGLAQIGVWQIIIYQAVWAIVLSVLPKFRKI
ncbi:MAG: hypothetical protein IIV47_00895 [Clostridia bacterium]|nr:hypothetical protein [Clostridia bacterium]